MERDKEENLMMTYQVFMDIGLGAEDLGRLPALVDERIFGIGTAVDEKIYGIPDVEKLIENQKKQSTGLDISWKQAPICRYITEDENTAVFADEIYLTIRAGEEIMEMYLRFSVVLYYVNGHWKVIHWHGSKPEQVESDKDTWGVYSWKQRAQELERLVEEKTADLVNKNRELEIESALERVRSRSLAMHKSNELIDVVTVLFEQISELRIPVTAVGIGIYIDGTSDYNAYVCGKLDGRITINQYRLPYVDNRIANDLLEAREKNLEFITGHYTKEEKDSFYAYVIEHSELKRQMPEDIRRFIFESTDYTISALLTKHAVIHINDFEGNAISDHELMILKRFANVFDQAYTRFLDLQKAEAQTREAQVEAALERVRSRSLAMHHTDELQDVVNVVAQQLLSMGIDMDGGIFMAINEEAGHDLPLWAAAGSADYVQKVCIPFLDKPIFTRLRDAIRDRTPFYTEFYAKSEKDEFLAHMFRHHPWNQNSEARKAELLARDGGYARSVSISRHTAIGIINHHGRIFSDADNAILRRFGAVLEQSYTRFLDLQKAEAQTREAQVEAALERVRARAMAMHTSNELGEVVRELRKQMGILGQKKLETCVIHLHDESPDGIQSWAGIKPPDEEGDILESIANVPKKGLRIIEEALAAYTANRQDYVLLNEGEKLRQWFSFLEKESPDGFARLVDAVHGNIEELQSYWSFADFSGGSLLMVTRDEPDEPTRGLLRRFSNVFGLAYRRFADLKYAEAQAREAQIEAALERVRSRSMAMHKSEELKEVIKVVLEQFVQLKINVGHSGFYIDYKANDDMHIWLADPNLEPFYATFPYFDTPTWNSFLDAKATGKNFHADLLDFEEKNKFYRSLFQLFEVPEDARKFYLECKGLAVSTVLLDNVGLYIENFDGIPYSDEENAILMRFGNVFQQTYTRFLDLQKAETQAREADIELALERIRSQAMAMRQSADLLDIVVTMRNEFTRLGHAAGYFWHMMWLPEKYEKAMTSGDGTRIGMVMELPRHIHGDIPLVADWEKGQAPTVVYAMDVDAAVAYVDKMIRLGNFRQVDPQAPTLDDIRHIGGLTFIMARTTHGEIGYSLPGVVEHPPAEDLRILERFAGAFDLAHGRFIDLKKSEARARDVQIELALERVRARALAMQQPEELREIAQVLRHEMGLLGVEELETSTVFLHDAGSEQAECWFAIRKGQDEDARLVSDHIALHLPSTQVGRHMAAFFDMENVRVSIPMRGPDRREWIKYCYAQSSVLDGFYGEHIPDRVYHLYKFSNGAIGAAAPDNISAESWDLLQRTASVFSLAYARFRDLTQARIDLQKLRDEKQRAESALAELRATQAQLVQAEKMASLGELTAGIAHEIQNPLNFVNNFAEVSQELADELKDEIGRGNVSDAVTVADDIRQNLQKILHHGKRADAIVKGMLQHSRSSTGTKELTDLNALADEYIRLAYHGLRAKDKSFNATFAADLDPALPNVEVVPQDIGRVLLNLINNAFYAVSEKHRQGEKDYVPTVTVRTLLTGDTIQIHVTDNGPGIPGSVREKIFQPFFTTKPTGQGTGLGLSLAYDIVTKGHRGELLMSTQEGLGTTFTIVLPVNE